jgi:hypothetical protein
VRDVVWIRRVSEDLSGRGGLRVRIWRIEGIRVEPGTRGQRGLLQFRRTLIDGLTGEILDDVGHDRDAHALDANRQTALSSRPSATSPGGAETPRGAA